MGKPRRRAERLATDGSAGRASPSGFTVCGWAMIIAFMMSTEFLAQPFVWRNWSVTDVLDGWLHVAFDRLMVAGAVAACLIIADRLRPPGRRGRPASFVVAAAVGGVLGEGLRLTADPFADRTDGPALVGRVVEWTLIAAAGIGILITWRLANDLATVAAETASAEARLRRTRTALEVDALQRQIEPHFLFNTLATIKRLSQTAPAQGQALVERLYDYVSSILDMSRRSRSTLGAELDLVLAYLDVCAVRMESRLAVINAVDPALRSLIVPPLMLGTLVENAIRHGLTPRASGGTLSLAASVVGDKLEITVTDDGVGLAGEGGGGIGLANLTSRLALLYGAEASFHLSGAEPHGAKALLRLPCASV